MIAVGDSVSVHQPRPMATLGGFVIYGYPSSVERGLPAIDRHRASSAVDDREAARFDGRTSRLLVSAVRISTSHLAWSDGERTSSVQRGWSKTCPKKGYLQTAEC
ncbi:hypothetical protein Zmor_022802 [Zophobas morio]|uniref:Uncharacterized protein n=1 Tax=Zophobas morio TaxID=2755281 RepID=A0AA38HW48_9CUCU|nr:hypothetical protein Zmor_022802 [Zophobas morio]